MKGRGLISVALVMGAMILGAFVAQYYTWTAPVQVKAVTTDAVPLSGAVEAGAVYNGTETYSGAVAITLPATTGENYRLNFLVDNFTGGNLTTIVADLRCTITWGGYSGSVVLVSDGADQLAGTITLNGPNNLGFAPGTTDTPAISIAENTKAVSTDTIVNFEIKVYLTQV
jgi:hypothetical protein